MGEYAFNWCSNLESVTLSASLKSIEKDTFTFCDILHEIDIPASVSGIGEDAFLGCRMLETITINNPDCNIFDQSDTICTEYDKDLKR
ncbi:MAG: leucine-rich repeat protein, partial [Bacilli bacterium]|nr:leucine-rich repeat protein [Bacilli bacterium]